MASDVTVNITDRAVISALNTPGGLVFEWRDDVATETVRVATMNSPVNNWMNARHRAGWTGEYKASWGFDRVGSNGHRVQATIYNGAGHADIVEFGRRSTIGSNRHETFSWTGHRPPGSVQTHTSGTRGRPGNFVLSKAVQSVMAAQGIAFSAV